MNMSHQDGACLSRVALIFVQHLVARMFLETSSQCCWGVVRVGLFASCSSGFAQNVSRPTGISTTSFATNPFQ